LKLISFSAQNTSLHVLLAFKVSVEKSDFDGFTFMYVICFFYLTDFNIFSLFSVLVVLMIICHGGCPILAKSVWFPVGFLYVNGKAFSRLGKFSVIILSRY
jgi:hypothetical protein